MVREQLLDILKRVKPGVANKDIVESMTYIFFSGTHVVTYNDRISIQHPLKTDFTTFVKSDDLYGVISKAKAQEVDINLKENKLNIKAKGLSVNLATIEDDEFLKRTSLVFKSLKKAKWKVLPNNFMDCIELCAFAAAQTESEYTLSCVKVEGNQCVASDNQRIAIATLEGKVDEMFLKATEIKNLTSIQPSYYFLSKAWAHFKSEEGCIFSIRRVRGLFPDFTEFAKFKGTTVKLPTSILEGAEIASVFKSEERPTITIEIEKGSIKISIKSESGGCKQKSKLKYDGKPLKFTINPDFLKEMMNHSTTIIVNGDKAKLTTENFTLVTSLSAD